MYEKILAVIITAAIILGVIWFVCRRDSDGRTSSGTGSDSRRVRDDLRKTEDENKQLRDAECRTRESIERAREASARASELIGGAREDNQRSQELVSKAKSILSSAKHTD